MHSPRRHEAGRSAGTWGTKGPRVQLRGQQAGWGKGWVRTSAGVSPGDVASWRIKLSEATSPFMRRVGVVSDDFLGYSKGTGDFVHDDPENLGQWTVDIDDSAPPDSFESDVVRTCHFRELDEECMNTLFDDGLHFTLTLDRQSHTLTVKGSVRTVILLDLPERGDLYPAFCFGDDEEHCELLDMIHGASGVSGEAAERELTRTRHELSVVQADLSRLRGGCVGDLAVRELEALQDELQDGLRRVRGEMRRRKAAEHVASHSPSFLCPIGHELMRDPVVAADGHTYERGSIEEWIQRQGADARSPKTNAKLAHTMLTPNHTLKASIDEAIEHAMCADQDNDDGEGEGAAGAASAKRPKR